MNISLNILTKGFVLLFGLFMPFQKTLLMSDNIFSDVHHVSSVFQSPCSFHYIFVRKVIVTLQISLFSSLPTAMTPLSSTQLSVSVGFKRLFLTLSPLCTPSE